MTFLFARETLPDRLGDQARRLTGQNIARARLTVEWEGMLALKADAARIADLEKRARDQEAVIHLLTAGPGLAGDVVRLAKALHHAADVLRSVGQHGEANRAREAIAAVGAVEKESA